MNEIWFKLKAELVDIAIGVIEFAGPLILCMILLAFLSILGFIHSK